MALLGHKIVHTEIVIPAPPEEIWAALTDPLGYPEWNPIFVYVEGEYREGAEMSYRMRDHRGKVTDVKSKVVKLVEPQVLNQFGGLRGVLTFDHTWQLESMDEGTRVIQHEEYRGIGVWFWDASWVEPLYRRANEA